VEVAAAMAQAAPDVVLLATEWQSRALIRAQLIEEGFEVLATDAWPVTRRFLRPGSKPKLVIVDLKNLPQPEQVLEDLDVLMQPDHVLVLVALGTVLPERAEAFGFHVVSRPATIARIVSDAIRVLR
jgi:hypothetical protein